MAFDARFGTRSVESSSQLSQVCFIACPKKAVPLEEREQNEHLSMIHAYHEGKCWK